MALKDNSGFEYINVKEEVTNAADMADEGNESSERTDTPEQVSQLYFCLCSCFISLCMF